MGWPRLPVALFSASFSVRAVFRNGCNLQQKQPQKRLAGLPRLSAGTAFSWPAPSPKLGLWARLEHLEKAAAPRVTERAREQRA